MWLSMIASQLSREIGGIGHPFGMTDRLGKRLELVIAYDLHHEVSVIREERREDQPRRRRSWFRSIPIEWYAR